MQALTADYVRAEESSAAIKMAFLEKWLSQIALDALARARNGRTDYVMPTTIRETFQHSRSGDVQALVCFLEHGAREAAREKKWDEALFLAKLSELPREESGGAVASNMTAFVLAEMEVGAGNLEDYADTLKNAIINRPTGIYTVSMLWAALDFSRLMNKLGKPAELEEVILPLILREGVSQAEIRAELETCYVWLRKSLANARIQQGRRDEAGKLLLETYEIVRSSSAKDGLNQWHAAWLLSRFLEPEAEAEKYRRDGETIFKHLYGSREKLESAEGLHMGTILLEAGSMEEAEWVFSCFYTLSMSVLGDGHEMTRRSLKLKQKAMDDWEIEKRNELEGNFAFVFGSFLNPRKIGVGT